MSHTGTWMNWPHKCDETCDQIECDIGITVVYRMVQGSCYYCLNCYYNAADENPLPETCPGCLYPIGRFIA